MPDQVVIVDPKGKLVDQKPKLTREQQDRISEVLDHMEDLFAYAGAFVMGAIIGSTAGAADHKPQNALLFGSMGLVFMRCCTTLPANASVSPVQTFGMAGFTGFMTMFTYDSFKKWFSKMFVLGGAGNSVAAYASWDDYLEELEKRAT
jgi:hypothetical protein